jgi:hypothetical protein
VDDEDLFHATLDSDSRDQGARLLLAEWLAERGDPRADGYRWMVLAGKYPTQDFLITLRPRTWDWWSMRPGWNGGEGDTNNKHDRVEPPLFDALTGCLRKSRWSKNGAYCEYASRRSAEEALCRALAACDYPPPARLEKIGR